MSKFNKLYENILSEYRKNKSTRYGVNKKMNSDVYKLRRKVIDIIYDAKKLVNLPRIDVRIYNNHKENKHVLGVGRMKGNIIWIDEDTLKMPDDEIRSVVLHEILHAVLGIDHIDKCPLMSPTHQKMSIDKQNKCFVSYFPEKDRK